VDALLVSRWWYQSQQDVSLIVVPPPQMVQNVKVGNMETFCVGEPWPAQTVTKELATQPSQLVNSGKIIQRALTMRADWRQNPKAAKAINGRAGSLGLLRRKTKRSWQDRRQTPVVEGGERYRGAIPG